MNRFRVRPLLAPIALGAGALLAWAPAMPASTAFAATSSHGSKATCSQLSKAQIQPLIVNPITKVTVKPLKDQQYAIGGSKKQVGQECIYAAGSGDSQALIVSVVGGPSAAVAYKGDLQGLGSDHVSVPGVGDKAVRASVDAKGEADTTELSSLKGSTYCSVTPQDGDVPGEAQLEEAAGDTGDIGNKAYAEIAAAIGTVCNRVYGSGNTKPDLSALTAAGAAAASASTTTTTLSALEP
jgi:hypothetical protein